MYVLLYLYDNSLKPCVTLKVIGVLEANVLESVYGLLLCKSRRQSQGSEHGWFQWHLSIHVSLQDCFPVLEMFQAQIHIIRKMGTMKMNMKWQAAWKEDVDKCQVFWKLWHSLHMRPGQVNCFLKNVWYFSPKTVSLIVWEKNKKLLHETKENVIPQYRR